MDGRCAVAESTRTWSAFRPTAVRFVVALATVFLLFGPYLSNSLRDLTLYLSMWQRGDMAVVLGMMVLLAALATGLDALFRRLDRPWLLRLYHHLFMVALGAGVLANIAFHFSRSEGWRIGRTGMEMQSLWLLLVAVAAYSFARPASPLVNWSARLCLIVSPGVPIVVFQLLTAPTYPLANDPLVPAPFIKAAASSDAPGNDRPVYLFVFDEWSYERTFDAGAVSPNLPHLSEFARRATVFHDARSPGEDTAWSMPALLFQTHRRPAMKGGRLGFDCDDRMAPTSEFRCLFSATADRHYRRIMIGAFLPYAAWLGDQVDVCRSYCYYPRPEVAWARVLTHGFNVMSYLTDPWSVLVHDKLKTGMNDRQILRIYDRTTEDILAVIQNQPPATFAVFHYMLPHEPFILNPDGTYRGPDESAWVRPNVEGYTRNLACLDRAIGRFTQAMRDAGRFDEAMIIFTSDHSWRFDPARKAGKIAASITHVPLLVKLPGQQDSISISDRFENRNLGSFIGWALGPQASPRLINDFVKGQAGDAAALVATSNGGAAR